MPDRKNPDLVREAVGVFDNAEALEAAVDELLISGFDRAAISLLASEPAILEKLGHMYTKTGDIEDDATVPRTAFVSTDSIGDAEGGLVGGLMYVGAVVAAGSIVASGGALATVLAGAALVGGTGGFIGAILAKWLSDHHANYIQEQLDRGGLLLWVRTFEKPDEKRATDILSKHSAHDVHIHGLSEAAG